MAKGARKSARKIEAALRDHLAELLTRPGVVGARVGNKEVGGRDTGQMAVIVEVEEKRAREELEAGELVPEVLEMDVGEAPIAVPTDVQPVGHERLEVLDKRVRPAPGGIQIEAENINATGTLGVNILFGEHFRLLTNNHVISENGNVGAAVYQPTEGKKNLLARVSGFVEVVTYAEKEQPRPVFNRMDLAWCNVDADTAAPSIEMLGTPAGIRAPRMNEKVRLVGKQTGTVQRARIVNTQLAKVLRWPDAQGDWAFFENMIQLDRVVTRAGDSGTAYVAVSDNYVVGIHVGANQMYSWGCTLGSK